MSDHSIKFEYNDVRWLRRIVKRAEEAGLTSVTVEWNDLENVATIHFDGTPPQNFTRFLNRVKTDIIPEADVIPEPKRETEGLRRELKQLQQLVLEMKTKLDRL